MTNRVYSPHNTLFAGTISKVLGPPSFWRVNEEITESISYPPGARYCTSNIAVPLELTKYLPQAYTEELRQYEVIQASGRIQRFFSQIVKWKLVNNAIHQLTTIELSAQDTKNELENLLNHLCHSGEDNLTRGALLGTSSFLGSPLEVHIENIEGRKYTQTVVVGDYHISWEDHFVGVGTGPFEAMSETYDAEGIVEGILYTLTLAFSLP